MQNSPTLIAVDWGTSRFRAYLVNDQGGVVDEVSSQEGISAIESDSFPMVLWKNCGRWIDALPQIPILMAGMVGSRNGWREVPYVSCPASIERVRNGIQAVEINGGVRPHIVPGLLCHRNGVADVIRGEETLIFGADADEAIIVLPGTHSKWAAVSRGEIDHFITFMTGEFYGLLRQNSVLRLLAKEPANRLGFTRGIQATRRDGGLLHQAFEARTAVLNQTMGGEEVGPFLSGLLIAHEINSAKHLMEQGPRLILVAEGELARNYAEVFDHFGIAPQIVPPRDCFVAGMLRLKGGA